jgi:hypothetical protein
VAFFGVAWLELLECTPFFSRNIDCNDAWMYERALRFSNSGQVRMKRIVMKKFTPVDECISSKIDALLLFKYLHYPEAPAELVAS